MVSHKAGNAAPAPTPSLFSTPSLDLLTQQNQPARKRARENKLKGNGKKQKQEQRMLVEESQHWETDLTACV